jgi:hypothetical protein
MQGFRVLAASLLLAASSAGAAASPHAASASHVVSASGQLIVLNGFGSVDLHAVAPPLLGIPAPAGVVSLVLYSTFGPPKPYEFLITLSCTAVAGGEFFGSGSDQDGTPFFVHLMPPAGAVGLWSFGWSTTPGPAPCSATTYAGYPILGPAAITP